MYPAWRLAAHEVDNARDCRDWQALFHRRAGCVNGFFNSALVFDRRGST